MHKWLLAAVALGGCAEMEKPEPIWATLDGNPPLVIAHRGASGYRPEHTLAAYALAVDMGADIIEPDLVFSKDGVLVARHDRYLSTTTDVADHPEFADRKRANEDAADTPREDWWVEDFTLAELKTLRARQPFPGRSKEFDGLYEIPTFDEMLVLVSRKSKEARRPVGVYPETKHPGFYAAKGYDFDAPLLKALSGFDAGPVFIQSFEPEILKRLKGKTSAKLVQLVYVRSVRSSPEAPTSNIPLAEIAAYSDGVGAEKRLADAFTSEARSEFVADAHALGLLVHLWTYRNDQPSSGLVEYWSEVKSGDLAVDDQIARDSSTFAEFELRRAFVFGTDGVFSDFADTAVAARLKISVERENRN